uniref:MerR family transcriptional regulator n=1 Tax=Yoonia sp. TaxID=2212373 RepID=UPI004047202F
MPAQQKLWELFMLTIGALARRAGSKVQTIRYYEQVGLLKPAKRTTGGQRRYGVDDIARLTFILHSRQFGFSLDVIRELLELSTGSQGSCEPATLAAHKQLNAVERHLSLLFNQKKALEQMVKGRTCDVVASCQVLEGLRGHCDGPLSNEAFGGQNNP